jgi:hypothetical protein
MKGGEIMFDMDSSMTDDLKRDIAIHATMSLVLDRIKTDGLEKTLEDLNKSMDFKNDALPKGDDSIWAGFLMSLKMMSAMIDKRG